VFQAKSVTVSPSSNRTHAYGSCGSELQSITVVYSRDQSVRLSVTFNFTMYGDSTYRMDSFSLEAVINGQMIDGWWILPIFKYHKLLVLLYSTCNYLCVLSSSAPADKQ